MKNSKNSIKIEMWTKENGLVDLSELFNSINSDANAKNLNLTPHREDGPAVIKTAVNKRKGNMILSESWYINGEKHRTDGPADILYNKKSGLIKSEKYFRNNRLHREDGPAVIYTEKNKSWNEWWFMGCKITKAALETIVRKNKFDLVL